MTPLIAARNARMLAELGLTAEEFAELAAGPETTLEDPARLAEEG